MMLKNTHLQAEARGQSWQSAGERSTRSGSSRAPSGRFTSPSGGDRSGSTKGTSNVSQQWQHWQLLLQKLEA
jgi:hypothetical protein